jgi:hypothetical protein
LNAKIADSTLFLDRVIFPSAALAKEVLASVGSSPASGSTKEAIDNE